MAFLGAAMVMVVLMVILSTSTSRLVAAVLAALVLIPFPVWCSERARPSRSGSSFSLPSDTTLSIFSSWCCLSRGVLPGRSRSSCSFLLLFRLQPSFFRRRFVRIWGEGWLLAVSFEL